LNADGVSYPNGNGATRSSRAVEPSGGLKAKDICKLHLYKEPSYPSHQSLLCSLSELPIAKFYLPAISNIKISVNMVVLLSLLVSAVVVMASPVNISSAVVPDPSQVYIQSITYGGTGCPQGTVGSFISSDSQTYVKKSTITVNNR
jgi:hypothetical protein